MNENDNGHSTTRRSRLGRLLFPGFGLVVGFCGSAAYATSEFHPRGEASVTWTDNVDLVNDSGQKESAYILQANPGFAWQQKAPRFHSFLDYTMQNIFDVSNHDRDTTYHQGAVGLGAELAPQYLYLDGSGSYSQQIIDPKVASTNSNLFGANNFADALSAQLSASLRHEFDAWQMDFRYARGLINYKAHKSSVAIPLQDAKTEDRSAFVASPNDELARVSWSAHYDSQIVRYESLQQFRFDQANAELGLLIVNGLRLVGRGGAESDPLLHPADGGLDQRTWEGGFIWKPSIRTHVEAFYGERFYGKSYSGLISHQARLLTLEVKYSEGPVTQAQQLNGRPIALDPTQLGGIVPGTTEFSRLTNSPYVRKFLEGTARFTGQRTEVVVGVTDDSREYIDATLGGERIRAVSLDFIRKLPGQTEFDIGASGDKTKLRDGEDYTDVYLRAGFNRRLTERIKWSARAFRNRRSGVVSGYVVNGVVLSVIGQY